MWSPHESCLSSTSKELIAILNVLKSFRSLLHNQIVIWFADSSNAASIVLHGSAKVHLQSLAVQIFDVCFELHIELRIEWLPRTDNHRADYLRRITDPDDRAISSKYFQILDQLWGPHTIDHFASDYNKQTKPL